MKNNEKIIWDFLLLKIDNEFGVAGLMGNLFAESGLNPRNMQNSFEQKLGYDDKSYTEAVDNETYNNFINDGVGYGLAQWTYWARKQNLLNYAKERKVSIGDLETQLGFLYFELENSFPNVLKALKNASTILEASNEVLLNYEKPADTSAFVRTKRSSYALSFYNKFKKSLSVLNKDLTTDIKKDFDIIEKFNLHNTSSLADRNIKYIVIHYTAGTSSKAGNAVNNALWFANAQCQCSADFIVDDDTIVQYNEDIENRYTWGVGGAKYSSVSTSLGAQHYGKCRNTNCINIEMCSNKTNKSSLNINDTDWYLTDKTIDNTVKLVKYLMKKYNISIDYVIMHHQVTGKVCPQPWCLKEENLVYWNNFLNKVQGKTEIKVEKPEKLIYVQTTVKALSVRKEPNVESDRTYIIRDKKIYTITEKQGDWGKLKSGIGWINLNYTKEVEYKG